MLTQEQFIQMFGAANAPSQPPPQATAQAAASPQSTLPIVDFHHHLQQHREKETAIAQHFDNLYQEQAQTEKYQFWLIVSVGVNFLILAVVLWLFFPIWVKYQHTSTVSQRPVSSLSA